MEPLKGRMNDMPRSELISTRQQRIATLAKQAPELSFTSLNHHLDIDWLREAYRRTRKDGATGIDGLTAEDYATHLESNLQSLLQRAKSGQYRAPAVRRVHIPKGDGSQTRPIGIPTFEDKILQRAVVMVLEPIYEQDFMDCSYGFRPRRSAHQALQTVWDEVMKMRGGWILEVDIEKFFDTLDKAQLRQFLRQRVRDGVLLRLIGKWLQAGVMEGGDTFYPEAGSPQGGVISPILSNLYLHEVLDVWFAKDVKPRLRGRSFLVRYADDAVMGFEYEADARRVLEVLPKRFARYGLKLHPDKTRLIPFGQPEMPGAGGGKPLGTFDLLGFTHYWARSRGGKWVVKQKTAKDRFSRGLRALREWCRANCHRPISEQHRALVRKLRGHYGYYGITGNSKAIARLRYFATGIWRWWLSRRSQRGRVTWQRLNSLLVRYPLPAAIAGHSRLKLAANP